MLKQLNKDETAPLFNRPTQGTYQPGSTMKVVTAAAALDSGEFTPDTVLSGHTGIEIGGVPLQNAGGESLRATSTWTTPSPTRSTPTSPRSARSSAPRRCSSTWTGSGSSRTRSSTSPTTRWRRAASTTRRASLLDAGDAIDIGRVAIGQERLLVTPMQMAEVAATVANDGTLMKPTFLQ